MDARHKALIVGLLLLILLTLSTMACEDGVPISGKEYTIAIGDDLHHCDGYEWSGADLTITGCGVLGYNKTYVNATNVTGAPRN